MTTKNSLVWQLKQRPGKTTAVLHGRIDEASDLSELADLEGEVIFNLADVKRINSEGARRWVDLMRRLQSRGEVVIEACSLAVVSQLNMLADLVGCAEVVSVYAPFSCQRCAAEQEALVRVDKALRDHKGAGFDLSCEQCGGKLVLDDDPDRYFAFLRPPLRSGSQG